MNFQFKKKNNNRWIKKVGLMMVVLSPTIALCEGPKKVSDTSNPYAIAMLSIAGILLLAIYIVSRMLIEQAKAKVERFQKSKNESLAKATNIITVLILCF